MSKNNSNSLNLEDKVVSKFEGIVRPPIVNTNPMRGHKGSGKGNGKGPYVSGT